MTEKKESRRKKLPETLVRFSNMSVKMAVAILAGVYAGRYLDERLSLETPWFTLFLSLFGLATAIYIIIKDTREINAKK